MRKIREILRLKHEGGHSNRQIAQICSVGRTTVGDYLLRAQVAELTWPLPDDLSEEQIEQRLFPSVSSRSHPSYPLPDWKKVHQELKEKGVTLSLLWMEYKTEHRDGYQYSRFCELYREWRGQLDPCLRQEHKA